MDENKIILKETVKNLLFYYSRKGMVEKYQDLSDSYENESQSELAISVISHLRAMLSFDLNMQIPQGKPVQIPVLFC